MRAVTPVGFRRLRKIVKPVNPARLLDHEGIWADDVPHTGVIDLPQLPDFLHGLKEGGREPAHVGNHHLHTGRVPGGDDLFDLTRRQAHGFLHQHVLALLRRQDGVLGVILVTVQDEDGVEIWQGGEFAGVCEAPLHAIGLADLPQDTRGDVTECGDLVAITERCQDRQVNDLGNFAQADNTDTYLVSHGVSLGMLRSSCAGSPTVLVVV
jgi:hypothetical protein